MEQNQAELRRGANRIGWSMLLYTALLFVFVLGEVLLRVVIAVVIGGGSVFLDGTVYDVIEGASSSGIGSLSAAVVSVLLLALIFRKAVPMPAVWKKDRSMTLLGFGKAFVVFMAFQFVFSLVSLLIEMGLNLFGLTSMEALNAVSGSSDTWSMLLYVGIAAPFTEEIVYRGFVLRGLAPYGKKMAIILSAILFGLAHGNIYQFFYAAAVGLVLGYVSMEFSIWWAIGLHLINNLVFANIWDRVLDLFPAMVQPILSWGLEAVFFVLAVIVLVCHRGEVAKGLICSKEERSVIRDFFRSDSIILFTIVQIILAIITFVSLITPIS